MSVRAWYLSLAAMRPGLKRLQWVRGDAGSPTKRAAIHRIVFPDFEGDSVFDPDDCVQFVEIVAGPSDVPGEEVFQAQVCTPAALSRMLADGEVLVGRHWLFVESFSPARVERFLRKMINNIEGQDWAEVAARLGRLAHYEFEDYSR